MTTATPTPRSTNPVIAEHLRVERIVSGMAIGETAVINGTPVTVISLPVDDLLNRHQAAASRCRRLSADATSDVDFEQLLDVQDELSLCRCQLASAGMLHLIEAV